MNFWGVKGFGLWARTRIGRQDFYRQVRSVIVAKDRGEPMTLKPDREICTVVSRENPRNAR
jgi:hypothetical protein